MRNGIVRYNSEGTDESGTIFSTLREWKSGISIYVYPVRPISAPNWPRLLPQADLIGALSMLVEQLFAGRGTGIVEA